MGTTTIRNAAGAASTTQQGLMQPVQVTKLDGIAEGATANRTDAATDTATTNAVNSHNTATGAHGLPALTGNGGKVVAVKADETGYEAVDAPSGTGTVTENHPHYVQDTEPAGVNDGTIWIDTSEDAQPYTFTSDQITDFAEAVYDTVAALLQQGTNVTLTKDDTTNTITVASTASGGGSGNGYGFWIDQPKTVAATPDDDFTSTPLAGKWSAITGTAGTVDLMSAANTAIYDLTTRPGLLLMQANGGNSIHLRQDYSLGDGESLIAAVNLGYSGALNNASAIGISLNDDTASATATGIKLEFDGQAAGTRYLYWNSSGATTIGATGDGTLAYIAHRAYFRISRSGLIYRAWASNDGDTWWHIGVFNATSAFTKCWLYLNTVSGAPTPTPIHAVDWFRVGNNTMKPW